MTPAATSLRIERLPLICLAGLMLFAPADVRPELLPAMLALGSLALLVARRLPPCGMGWLLGWFLLSAASLAWSPSLGPGLDALFRVVLCMVAFLAASAEDTDFPLTPLVAGAALFHGLNAALQHWLWLPAAAAQVDGSAGMEASLLHQRLVGARAFSTFALPGHLGAVLAALLPILALALVARRRIVERVLLCAAIAMCLLGLFAASALGAVVCLMLVVTGMLWAGRRRLSGRSLLAVGVALVVVALAVVAARSGDLVNWHARDHPLAPRLALWQRALDVIAADPISGSGLGSYPEVWLASARTGDVQARNAHMSWLECAAESGIPAAILLAGLFVSVLRRSRDPATAAALLVLLVHSCGDFDLQSSGLAPILFLLAGFACGRHADAGGQPPGVPAFPPAVRLVFASIVVVICVAATARERGRLLPGGSDASARVLNHERAASRWPFDARVHAELGRARMELGESAAAIAAIGQARRLAPRAAWIAALEGEARFRSGEVFASWFAWRDAALLFPARVEYAEAAGVLERRLAEARTQPSMGPQP